MKISLSENIRALRKERRMTQEQLAEALRVTVGAVHKWESKSSLPEIRLLMEMADLFCVSVDVLLGYEMKSSGVEDIIERIKSHLRAKDFETTLAEAEKALIRYPNIFSIVHCCADAYERKGIETGDPEAIKRAIGLMERSISLLSQNDDPEISEVTIRSDIATCYIVLKQTDKGLEILKKYNAGGINNTLLGLTYSQSERFDPEEAEKYLERGMADVITHSIRCMSGYVNYYIRKEEINSALEASLWLIQLLESLKTDSSEVCYLDKIISSFQAVSASFLSYLGKPLESEKLLLEAYRRSAAFDAAPVYGAYAIRFCLGDTQKATASDDLGETAMAAIEKHLRSDERFRPTLEMWEGLKVKYPVANKEDSDNA
ncbi:MAG: helix-turn-helix transcriptional regulator [Oscillospiraceae bacterium]|nr:helix-turn-helix transcriptional regulator [Oscillospiraceae bacterium]